MSLNSFFLSTCLGMLITHIYKFGRLSYLITIFTLLFTPENIQNTFILFAIKLAFDPPPPIKLS